MSWRLRIEHTTKVVYTGPVRTSFNEARMTPLTLPTQTTLESRVTAGPGVPGLDLQRLLGHPRLRLRPARPARRPGDPGDLDGGDRAVRGHPGRRHPARLAGAPRARGRGRLLEFLLPTALTTVTEEISDAAIARSPAALGPDEAAAAISARVRDHVTYLPGATGVRTNAQEAWDKGQGVCQDMAQIAVSLLRAAGLPARYVSGYLHPDPKARAGQHRRSASRTPGSSTGPARGPRSTRPAAPRSASATSPSPAAATTPTSRRSRASTTARPTATCRSRSRSPASPEPDQDQIPFIERSRGPASQLHSFRRPGRPPTRPRSVTMEAAAAPARSEPERRPRWIRRRGQGSPTRAFPGSSARDVLARCVGPGRRDTQ